MDPEQIYQEVLQEEQQKGSAAPVAEGRAKAARQRAVHGSPHPKEPKWWPGAQPQFEGGNGSAPAPAAEAPAPEPEPEPAPAPAAETPAPAPAPAAPAPAPVEQPAAVAAAPAAAAQAQAPAPVVAAPAATGPYETQKLGVTHGTPTGNRLRPEDSVASEAQFDGERAMRERRRVIDELVASGVPAVTAQSTGGGASPLLLLLYILIPLVAIAIVVGQQDELAPASETTQESGGGGETAGPSITASGTAFSTDTLELPAKGETTLHFVNEDTVAHNVSIYEDDSAKDAIFQGATITDDETDYEISGPGKPGEAYFQCDIHPTMNGTVTFK